MLSAAESTTVPSRNQRVAAPRSRQYSDSPAKPGMIS